MFQLVDTLDCNSAGSAYLVNLYGGMRIVVQNQFGGAFYRLGYHAHAVLGVNAQFYSGLHGCLDILQYISDAAGSHGGGCRYLIFGNQHGKSHLVEDVEQKLFLFLAGVTACNERHAFHLADGGVGDEAEHGHLLVCHFFKTDAGSYGDKYLLAFELEFAYHRFYQPRFDGEYDELGAGNGFLIVACGLQSGEFSL